MTQHPSSFFFRLLHQNIAGIISKKDIFTLALYELGKSDKLPDIICLTESFVKSGCEDNVIINGYTLGASFSRIEKERGGVCLLISNDLDFRKVREFDKLAQKNTFECCAIEVLNFNIIIIGLYRIPVTKNLSTFFDKLELMLFTITKKFSKKKIIILGDININTLKDTIYSQRLKDVVKNNNLILHIDQPTRQTSCIDHIISNIKKAKGSTIPLCLSDHNTAQMLTIPLKNKNIEDKCNFLIKRDYSLENIIKFRGYLKSISWNNVFDEDDFNRAFSEFHDLFCLLYKLCFPEIKIKINKNTGINWISKGLRQSCKTNRKLRYNYYKNKSDHNKIKYNKYSKLLKKCLVFARKNTNNKILSRSNNVCKTSWNIIKNETSQPTKQQNIKMISHLNKTYSDPTDIANIFNNHFIDIADKSNIDLKKPKDMIGLQNSIYLKSFEVDEIKSIILSLNNTKAVGYDGISTLVLKCCCEEIGSILTYLVGMSFEQGCFPESLKTSLVKPLFKKGDKNILNNYRPIVLPSIFSKIFEKCMHLRLINFFEKYKIIKSEQHGFQKNKSTIGAVFELVSYAIYNIDIQMKTTVFFFDMSKAFDMVPHDLLLYKLEKYGIRGNTLNWLQSYLTNRQQCVEIEYTNDEKVKQQCRSYYRTNTFGVPQGSVLGPLLFIIFINDLPGIIKHKIILFADDISLIIKGNEKTSAEHEYEVNMAVKEVIKWLSKNNLSVNLNKTNYMHFNKGLNRNKEINIEYDGQLLNQANIVTFLGITIDENFNWKTHINNICCKLNKYVYVLFRLRKIASLESTLFAYYGYVESVLRYGVIVWGNSADINKAFLAQKKCIRAIAGVAPYISCKLLFQKFKILPLPCIYILEIVKFVKLNLSLFQKASDIYPRNTRRGDRLVHGHVPRTKMYFNNCYGMCIKIYNKLPEAIKCLPFRRFKKAVHELLLKECYYSVKEFL